MELFFATLILALLACVRSQDLNSTIVGCVDLDCPASTADTANDNCTVADKSFTYVGLTRIPTTQESLQGLSWTKGFNIIDLPNNNRTFQNSFYLGTPPDLKLSSTGACSVFFHGVSTSLSFGGDNGKNETSQGTCADAMGSDCVNALLNRAKTFIKESENNNTSDTDLCSALQDHLHNNMDTPCLRISGGSWTNLSSTEITGNGSPQPISKEDNSTSTCWPVLPKQNQLTHVADYMVPGTHLEKDAQTALAAITPIITVFYPEEKGSIVGDIDASLTCVKVLGPPRASLDTMSDGSAEGLAASLSPSLTTLAAIGSFVAVFFVSV
ncbi:hypothetical protein F5B17DRAFT_392343 [Nemania serpens]|nr:hypothetical protein F5B17DRAFT_392343 [Nemania serpens]